MIRRLRQAWTKRQARIVEQRTQYAARTKGDPRPAPALAPAPPITLPAQPALCGGCGDPLTFGAIHRCGLGADIRKDRVA